MKKSILTVGLFSLAATVTAATLKNGESVAFLGDSITELGWNKGTGYVRMCETAFRTVGLTNIVIHPAGLSGNTSDQMLKRFKHGIIQKKPTYLTLSCGVNDVAHQGYLVPLPRFKENVKTIVTEAQAAGIKVILFTPTMVQENPDNKFNKQLIDYNNFLRAFAKEKGCALVDMHAEMQRQVADYQKRAGVKGNFITVDGIHMDYLGDLMMAKMVLKDGFGFTEAELAKAQKEILRWPRMNVSLSADGNVAFCDKVGLNGNLYLKVVEKAIAAKMTPTEFMRKKFGARLNTQVGQLFKDMCYLRTEKGPVPHPRLEKVELPIWDISNDTNRQAVVAAGTARAFHGQAATARAADGTIYAVWSRGHGGPAGPMAMSKDDGKTWTRVDERLPEVYKKKFTNCPVIYNIVDKNGKSRLFIMANLERKRSKDHGILMSEDNGVTWVERPTEPWACWNPPTGILRLADGSTALFGQRMQAHIKNDVDRPTDDQEIWMSVTTDGGLTWSPQRTVAQARFKNLCEPFAFRSDDGKEIGLLIRENRHTARSMMCFSRDEGKTWTQPMDTCRGLTGDRHQGVRAPDGRWVITYRDLAHKSPTFGQYMAWVGTYDDIRNGRPGQFRIHLLNHRISEGWAMRDTGYSGVECLPDGTILCTTYTQHTTENVGRSIVATRFKLDECDPKKDLK